MDEAQYQAEMERIFLAVEDAIDQRELDVDIDSTGGILTVTFEDGSAIIFSRQPASRELWIAARSGGFHLANEGGAWRCGGTGETLAELVNRTFSEQAGEKVELLESGPPPQ